MCAGGNALDKLARYAAAAERSYYKALRELRSSRQFRNEHKTAIRDAALQNEPNPTGHRPLDTGHCFLQNEPNFRPASVAARPPKEAVA